ncbi:MAG: helix-turn-helix transcriptional regulator [Clostridia bacterium]|nr:helix-turn-helix transcriptional regulator [Clostridia bacterium]
MFFRHIRDLREDHDLKQKEVAAILGIKQTVYSRYERGYQTIPVEHALKLADYYHVSTDYLFDRTDNPAVLS